MIYNLDALDAPVGSVDWKSVHKMLGVFTPKELEAEIIKPYFLQLPQSIRFCKIEQHSRYTFATFYIPSKGAGEKHVTISCYLFQDNLVFIDSQEYSKELLLHLIERTEQNQFKPDTLLYLFMDLMLDGDLEQLDHIQDKLSGLENAALYGEMKNFNQMMMRVKKEILHLYRYYGQLLNMGEKMMELELFSNENREAFRLLLSRISRFQDETKMFREYAVQVREVYQSQIDIRQNNIMKILTIVTTIFFPLSVIAGWYGMNFTFMPELSSPFGYPAVIAASIGALIGEIWLLKKKKFW